jgi:ribonuclease HII
MNVITVGIDEAGRGPVFGPMVVAAVATNGWYDERVRDSKKMTARARQELFSLIRQHCVSHVSVIEPAKIDKYGMHKCVVLSFASVATRTRETLLVAGIDSSRIRVIADGICPKTGDEYTDTMSAANIDEWMTKGEDRVFEIAAASIVAKVTHDQIIRDLLAKDPSLNRYGLKTNMGYGTTEHAEALIRYGPSRHHRACAKSLIHTQTKKKTSLSMPAVSGPHQH